MQAQQKKADGAVPAAAAATAADRPADDALPGRVNLARRQPGRLAVGDTVSLLQRSLLKPHDPIGMEREGLQMTVSPMLTSFR
eukprot:SAG22_NODE_5300_length_1042_cov_0.863203_1_plen_83_part_00